MQFDIFDFNIDIWTDNLGKSKYLITMNNYIFVLLINQTTHVILNYVLTLQSIQEIQEIFVRLFEIGIMDSETTDHFLKGVNFKCNKITRKANQNYF